jgi:RimJ/RimL family protein N-acetyltransferase
VIVTDARVAAFVGDAVARKFAPPFSCLGLERNGQIVSGVVFNVYEGTDIHATIAGHVWTKGLLADVGDYAFNQLGCLRITALTEQTSIVRLAERLGGKVEGLLRDHFGKGRDGYIVGVLKDDYRF